MSNKSTMTTTTTTTRPEPTSPFLWNSHRREPHHIDIHDKEEDKPNDEYFVSPTVTINTCNFLALEYAQAKTFRFPPGCTVLAWLGVRPQATTTMVVMDTIRTVHLNTSTGQVLYQLQCHGQCYCTDDALAFGRGTTVWMRLDNNDDNDGYVAGQIVAASLGGTTTTTTTTIYYSALVDDVTTTDDGTVLHGIPNHNVVYRFPGEEDPPLPLTNHGGGDLPSALSWDFLTIPEDSSHHDDVDDDLDNDIIINNNNKEPNANNVTTAATATSPPTVSPVTVMLPEGLTSQEDASKQTVVVAVLSTTKAPPKSWATVLCETKPVATVPRLIKKDPTLTYTIPGWVATAKLQALFKAKRKGLEMKYRCTLMWNNNNNNNNTNTGDWNIGIYGAFYNTTSGMLSAKGNALLTELYDLAFSYCSHVDERLLLAHDLTRQNRAHHHPPVETYLDTTIVWQHAGNSKKHKRWMAIVDIDAACHEAVPLLVGPAGAGVKEIYFQTSAYVYVLERPRIAFFVACDKLEGVKACLPKAFRRLAWAKGRLPRLFKTGNDNKTGATA